MWNYISIYYSQEDLHFNRAYAECQQMQSLGANTEYYYRCRKHSYNKTCQDESYYTAGKLCAICISLSTTADLLSITETTSTGC